MTQRVKPMPPNMLEATSAAQQIRAALPVRGYGQWETMAQCANWLAGCGAVLANAGPINETISAGSSHSRRFYCWPHDYATREGRLFIIELVAASAGGSHGTVTLAPGGDAFDWAVPNTKPHTLMFVHEPSSTTAGEVSVQVSVDSAAAGAVTLQTVTVAELPRWEHDDATTTAGTHETSCVGAQPIYENTDTDDKFSVQSVFEQVREQGDNHTRCSLFSWYNAAGLTTTATAFSGTSNIFRIDPAVQTRLLTASVTTRTVAWAVYAVAAGASSGEVKVTMTNGSTSTITVANTTIAWTTGTVSVETDSMTETALIRGGTRDTAVFEFRDVTGTGITLYGIRMGEP